MPMKKNSGAIGAVLQRLKALFVKPGNQQQRLHLPDLSPGEITRVYNRLGRLYVLYRREYRLGGNLMIPEVESIDGDSVVARLEPSMAPEMSLDTMDQVLTNVQIDILMGTLLAQLAQLRRLNYTLDAISPDNLRVRQRDVHWAFALGGLEHGRFQDEPVGKENRVETPWPSPEYWRWTHYSVVDGSDTRGDVFAAGCIYYSLLTKHALQIEPDLSAGASIVRGLPVPIDGPDKPRLELIRWMTRPEPDGRPTAEQALAALGALRGLSSEDVGRSDPRRPYLTMLNDCVAQARHMGWLWQPDERTMQETPSPLFEWQSGFRAREMNRLEAICQLSQSWSSTCLGISPCVIRHDDQGVTMVSPLPKGPLLTLRQLSKLYDSPFLLDARMVDLLLAVHTLHEDGWIMGFVSEERFCIQVTPSGGQAWVIDLSAAIPLNDLPVPRDIHTDEESVALLSPELALYLVSASAAECQVAEGWVSPASDVFSLGLLYHLMLTGQLPEIIKDDVVSFAEAVRSEEYAWHAIALDSRLDKRHSDLIYEMLNANPMTRPADCGALAWRILEFYTA